MEAGKYKIKLPADSVSGQNCSVSKMATCFCILWRRQILGLYMAGGMEGQKGLASLFQLFYEDTNLISEDRALMA
jgi:hypothetical protein